MTAKVSVKYPNIQFYKHVRCGSRVVSWWRKDGKKKSNSGCSQI